MQESVNRLGALADEFREARGAPRRPRYDERPRPAADRVAAGTASSNRSSPPSRRSAPGKVTSPSPASCSSTPPRTNAPTSRTRSTRRWARSNASKASCASCCCRDPHAGRAVIMEIRGAEGGEEANLFARDLYDMYLAYAGNRGGRPRRCRTTRANWAVSTRSRSSCAARTRQRLKFEGGPHRVQRVPVTESQGACTRRRRRWRCSPRPTRST